MRSELEDGLFFVAFVSQERLEKIAAENKPYAGEDLRWYRRLVLGKKGPDGNYELPEWSNASYDTFSEEALQDDIVFLNGNKTTLADNEVVLTHRLFAYEVYELYSNKIETLTKPENWAQIERL